MSDEWEDLRPDSGDYGISVKEALSDVACFFASIVLAALRILLAVAPLVFAVVLLLAAAKYLTGW